MAVTGTIRAHGDVVGLAAGSRLLDLVWTITNGIEYAATITVLTTATPIAIFAGSTICAIIPPTNNATVLTFSTDGVTFVPVGMTTPMLFPCAGVTTLYYQAASGTVPVAVVQV